MPTYSTDSPSEALASHLAAFFEGHQIEATTWPLGPAEERLPGFFVYEIGPGPRFPGWTYVSSGCWTAAHDVAGHGLEFVLSANTFDRRHVELVTMASYYHAGPDSQRLDWGHTVPVGEAWAGSGSCDSLLVSLPYAYGQDLESCAWATGHARLLALLPITEAEREFKVEHGVEALEQRLEDAAVDFANPKRASVV